MKIPHKRRVGTKSLPQYVTRTKHQRVCTRRLFAVCPHAYNAVDEQEKLQRQRHESTAKDTHLKMSRIMPSRHKPADISCRVLNTADRQSHITFAKGLRCVENIAQGQAHNTLPKAHRIEVHQKKEKAERKRNTNQSKE